MIMNRSKYFDYIEDKINFLSYRIKNRGKINLLDLNIHSETFFAEMLNKVLDLKLKNMNAIKQNVEGIDLIDEENKVIAQVSSTYTKTKIENSLKKDIIKQYSDYRFIFVPIVGDSPNFRNKIIANPYGINFNISEDIYDIPRILRIVSSMSIRNQKNIYTFIQDELGGDIDIVKVDTNLATIINILAEENLTNVEPPQINDFEIERKIDFNHLQKAKDIIENYKVYYSKLDEKYKEFDKQGANKSLSVFSTLFKQYNLLKRKIDDDVELFYTLIDEVVKYIQNSKNYAEIAYEELEMCVCIIVVDAFIRCKIFKNPKGYNHVATR